MPVVSAREAGQDAVQASQPALDLGVAPCLGPLCNTQVADLDASSLESTAIAYYEKTRALTPQEPAPGESSQSCNFPSRSSEAERLAAVREFQSVRHNSAIDSILLAVRQLLKVTSTGVTLLDTDGIHVRETVGHHLGAEGSRNKLPGFCLWTLLTDEPVTMVVEDTMRDARVSSTEHVSKPPYIRFYAASPLVTSNRLRIGTLCVLHSQPMRFDDGQAAALNNLAELIMRVLEGALLQQKPSSPILQSSKRRDALAYDQAYALVDTSEPSWKILHATPAFSRCSGATEVLGDNDHNLGFWELFTNLDGEKGISLEDAGRSSSTSSQDSMGGNSSGTVTWRVEDKRTKMQLAAIITPLTAEKLDEHAIPMGNPARMHPDVPPNAEAVKLDSVFFVLLRAVAAPKKRKQLPFASLRLGPFLGAGAYAKVYRGLLRGRKVAVKVVHDLVGASGPGLPLEVLAMQPLRHSNVVELIDYKLVQASKKQLWLVLEYCNAGRLADAIDRGLLREEPNLSSRPCLGSILATGAGIADGLAHIHAAGIIHCDISAENVLLKWAPGAQPGFTTKIADFGLAKFAPVEAADEMMGNAPYFAPELLSSQAPSQASDVYALGVLLVEMLTGCRAWAGYTMAQIYYAVVVTGERFCTPDSVGIPDALRAAVDACLACDPGHRCSAEQLSERLRELRDSISPVVRGLDKNKDQEAVACPSESG